MLTLQFDVLIVGGGIVGVSIARELSRFKLLVGLVEKEVDVGFGTSKANSGVIHTGLHSSKHLLKTQLCVKGNRLFDRIAEELAIPFKRVGELIVAKNDTERQQLYRLLSQGKENGVKGLKLVDSVELRKLEPNLSSEINSALYAPFAGVICPYELVFAYYENACANGVRFLLAEKVIKITKQNIVYTSNKRKIHTKFIINAAGVYADEVAKLANVADFCIIPRKGEEYLLDKKKENIVRHIIFPLPSSKSKGILIIPTVDGPIMIGPTAEEVISKTDLSTSTKGKTQILDNVRKLIPTISAKDIIASFAGIRHVVPTEDFLISVTTRKGFINVAGIQSPGLTAAPAISQLVIEILKDEGLKLKPNPRFYPIRQPIKKIRALSPAQINRLIKKEDTRYGNLVCRCEIVSEKEIIDAIDRGATTMDGIKFRTRAGMGRCQGSFCSFRIIEILSQKLGVDILRISKRGAGSEILLKKTK